MNTRKKVTKWERIRSLFQTIHLWLGLIGGLFLFVICLTGTIYTFADEIKKMLNPDLYSVEAQAHKISINDLEKIIIQDIQSDVAGVIIPDSETEPYIFLHQKEGERRPTQIKINQYTGEILRPDGKEKGAEFFTTVFKMHRWLLLDTKVGRPIVGVATIMFAIGCITGLVIWFPRKIKNWKQGLKIKTGNRKRLNHDLHNALGFYSFIFLLIMALTGLTWSFEWYKTGYNNVLGASHLNKKSPQPKPTQESSENTSPEVVVENTEIDWDKIYAESKPYFDYEGNTRITKGKKNSEPLTMTKAGTSFWAYANSDVVKINAQNLELVNHEIFTEKPLGHQLALSYKSIHMGYIFGTGTKIIFFISCLIATSLPVTGVIIYVNRLKKKKNRKSGKGSLKTS